MEFSAKKSVHEYYRNRPFFSLEQKRYFRERTFKLVECIRDNSIDTLFFLDKSARPLWWMFYCAWKSQYPNEKIPDVKFINPDFVLKQNLDALDDYKIKKDSRILVVDTLSTSGDSLSYAKELLLDNFSPSFISSFTYEEGKVPFKDITKSEIKFPWYKNVGKFGVFDFFGYRLTDAKDLTLVEDDEVGPWEMNIKAKPIRGRIIPNIFGFKKRSISPKEARLMGLKLRREISEMFKYPN